MSAAGIARFGWLLDQPDLNGPTTLMASLRVFALPREVSPIGWLASRNEVPTRREQESHKNGWGDVPGGCKEERASQIGAFGRSERTYAPDGCACCSSDQD